MSDKVTVANATPRPLPVGPGLLLPGDKPISVPRTPVIDAYLADGKLREEKPKARARTTDSESEES